MHYAYFVSIPKDEAETPEAAIRTAEQFLDSNAFVSEGGLYAGGKCDWYEVGGRWSGLFTEMRPEYTAFMSAVKTMLAKDFPTIADDFLQTHSYGSPDKNLLRDKAQAKVLKLWEKSGIEGVSCPLARGGTFSWKGQERNQFDDAQLLTQEQYDALIAKDGGYGDSEVVMTDTYEESTIKNSPEMVGRWCVVIDYHN